MGMLKSILWMFSVIFSLYILTFYGVSAYVRKPEMWNSVLHGLYRPDQQLPNLGMAFHLFFGAFILISGPLQFVPAIRRNYPRFHRSNGKMFVLASVLTGAGGLTYIVMRGTSGGIWMDTGFGLSGIIMIFFAVMTAVCAIKGQREVHGKWALRLFCVAIGPFLYRIEYALWAVLNGGVLTGHLPTWDGWFDKIMNFGYYVPNIILCEIYIKNRDQLGTWKLNHPLATRSVIFAATTCLLMGGVFTAWRWWFPQISALLAKI